MGEGIFILIITTLTYTLQVTVWAIYTFSSNLTLLAHRQEAVKSYLCFLGFLYFILMEERRWCIVYSPKCSRHWSELSNPKLLYELTLGTKINDKNKKNIICTKKYNVLFVMCPMSECIARNKLLPNCKWTESFQN